MPHNEPCPKEVDHANADLIAAAPEMLSMLEYLVEKMDVKPGEYEHDAVLALIKKARGES